MATKQNSGVVDGSGNPVLDGSGNPIMSGRFPDEDEITARGRARNAAMFKSFANRLTGKKEEAKKAAPAFSPPTRPGQETSGLKAVSPSAAPTPTGSRPTRPGQQVSGQTFGQAFAAARKEGKKTFSFKGKSFTTETKEDVDKRRSNKARQQATEKKERETNRIKRSVGDAVSKAEAKKPETSPAQKFREQNEKGVSPILTGLLGFGAGFAAKKLVPAGARKLASKKAASTATKRPLRVTSAKNPRTLTSQAPTTSPLRQKTEKLIKGDKNPGRSVSPATIRGSPADRTRELIRDDRAARSANTSKQVTAKETPFKAAAKTKERGARAAKRRSEMLEENAKRYGLDPKAPGYESAIKAMRKDMGGKDFSFKKGGRVTVSSVSKRADGIAVKGKTRGKVY